jgi:hypothetical protein
MTPDGTLNCEPAGGFDEHQKPWEVRKARRNNAEKKKRTVWRASAGTVVSVPNIVGVRLLKYTPTKRCTPEAARRSRRYLQRAGNAVYREAGENHATH